MPVANLNRWPPRRPVTMRFCLLAALAGLLLTANAMGEQLFTAFQIDADLPARPTVMTGAFLDGESPQVALVYLDDNRAPRIRFYRLEEHGWTSALEAPLATGIHFVDVLNIAGRDHLIFYRDGRIDWFDPRSSSESVLLEISIPYQGASSGPVYAGAELLDPSHDSDIHQVDITRDLNGDGHEDLILPDFDGFWIALQQVPGVFGKAGKIGPPEPNLHQHGLNDQRSYREAGLNALTIPWYLQRLHQMDENQDGLKDLVFWNQDHFEVYHQNQDRSYESVPESFSTDVGFDLDGAHAILFAFGGEGTLALLTGFREKNNIKVLRELRDVNGDGIADLITQTLQGRSLLRQSSAYAAHPGQLHADGVRFSEQAVVLLKPRGKAGAMLMSGYGSDRLGDLDGDGQPDFMFRNVAIGPVGMLRATIGNSVPVNLDFYRGDNGSFPDKPTLRRKIRRFAPFAGIGNVHFPAVMLGDVTGDGRHDLLVGQGPKSLRVWPGDSGAKLFADEAKTISVDLPPDERNAWLADVDRDGKQDVLILLKPTGHNPAQPYRLTTLIAR